MTNHTAGTLDEILLAATYPVELGMSLDPEERMQQIQAADAVDSPTKYPLIAIRWTDERAGVGPVRRKPFEMWIYDEGKDLTRIKALGFFLMETLLREIEQVEVTGGWLIKIETSGDGLGKGRDVYDDSWKASTIVYRAQAIGSGL